LFQETFLKGLGSNPRLLKRPSSHYPPLSVKVDQPYSSPHIDSLSNSYSHYDPLSLSPYSETKENQGKGITRFLLTSLTGLTSKLCNGLNDLTRSWSSSSASGNGSLLSSTHSHSHSHINTGSSSQDDKLTKKV